MTCYEIVRTKNMIIDGVHCPRGNSCTEESEEEGSKVVTYVSRALTPVEKRYKNQIEWEHLHLNGSVSSQVLCNWC